ncbi:MAG: hypothetical protein ACK5IM_14530, partial [Demequina sp.]|uniref:hypothetical protein n=1 Tax=Demequina sp. TaxID=2050685 RepID=UPI003A88F8C7
MAEVPAITQALHELRKALAVARDLLSRHPVAQRVGDERGLDRAGAGWGTKVRGREVVVDVAGGRVGVARGDSRLQGHDPGIGLRQVVETVHELSAARAAKRDGPQLPHHRHPHAAARGD